MKRRGVPCEHKVGDVLSSQVAPDAATQFLACIINRDESFHCVRLREELERSIYLKRAIRDFSGKNDCFDS